MQILPAMQTAEISAPAHKNGFAPIAVASDPTIGNTKMARPRTNSNLFNNLHHHY